MVVIFFPSTALTGTTQERIGAPSTCTVQTPHWATPQPYLVPTKFRVSRSTQSSGVLESTSSAMVWTWPLTFIFSIVVRPVSKRADIGSVGFGLQGKP